MNLFKQHVSSWIVSKSSVLGWKPTYHLSDTSYILHGYKQLHSYIFWPVSHHWVVHISSKVKFIAAVLLIWDLSLYSILILWTSVKFNIIVYSHKHISIHFTISQYNICTKVMTHNDCNFVIGYPITGSYCRTFYLQMRPHLLVTVLLIPATVITGRRITLMLPFKKFPNTVLLERLVWHY